MWGKLNIFVSWIIIFLVIGSITYVYTKSFCTLFQSNRELFFKALKFGIGLGVGSLSLIFGVILILPPKYRINFQSFLSSFVRARLFTILPIISPSTRSFLPFSSLRSRIIGWMLLVLGTGFILFGIHTGPP